VVLKPQLAECAKTFAHYVIAHELAHACLHNGGWREMDDPETAADALAACWGFPKPAV
jgi:Zn-dependent peptidase ImmA (M78 family)